MQDITISWAQIAKDSRELARLMQDVPIDGIIGVARGGLIPAALVGRILGIDRFETLNIRTYKDRKLAKPRITHLPQINLDQNWIMIDELSDSGTTSIFIKKRFPKLKFAVLYVKPKGKPAADFFVREYPQDSWLILPWEKMKP